jgi:hypothetical protein
MNITIDTTMLWELFWAFQVLCFIYKVGPIVAEHFEGKREAVKYRRRQNAEALRVALMTPEEARAYDEEKMRKVYATLDREERNQHNRKMGWPLEVA